MIEILRKNASLFTVTLIVSVLEALSVRGTQVSPILMFVLPLIWLVAGAELRCGNEAIELIQRGPKRNRYILLSISMSVLILSGPIAMCLMGVLDGHFVVAVDFAAICAVCITAMIYFQTSEETEQS